MAAIFVLGINREKNFKKLLSYVPEAPGRGVNDEIVVITDCVQKDFNIGKH